MGWLVDGWRKGCGRIILSVTTAAVRQRRARADDLLGSLANVPAVERICGGNLGIYGFF